MSVEARNHTIDILRGLAILLVVFGHITRTMWLNSYIWSFHIPVFFLLSGYLYDPNKFAMFGAFVKRKFKGLIIPYLIFGGLTYLYWLLAESRFRGSDLNAWEQLLGIFYGSRYEHFLDFNGPLWFIPCLFTMSIIYYFIDRIRVNWLKCIVVATFFSLGTCSRDYCPWLPFGICAASIGIVFYAIGNVIRNFSDAVLKTKKIINIINSHYILCILVIIALIALQVWLTPYSKANLARLETGNPIIYLGMACLGIFIYWLISVLIGKSKLLEWLGINSLVIFALHGPVYRALIFVASFITKNDQMTIRQNMMYVLIITVITIIVIFPIIQLWNKWGKPLTR